MKPKLIVAFLCPYNFPCDECEMKQDAGCCPYTDEMKVAALLSELEKLTGKKYEPREC